MDMYNEQLQCMYLHARDCSVVLASWDSRICKSSPQDSECESWSHLWVMRSSLVSPCTDYLISGWQCVSSQAVAAQFVVVRRQWNTSCIVQSPRIPKGLDLQCSALCSVAAEMPDRRSLCPILRLLSHMIRGVRSGEVLVL
jgi:hypothetical protein